MGEYVPNSLTKLLARLYNTQCVGSVLLSLFVETSYIEHTISDGERTWHTAVDSLRFRGF